MKEGGKSPLTIFRSQLRTKNAPGREKFGAILRSLREQKIDSHNKVWTQSELYCQCRDLQPRAENKTRKDVPFPSGNTDYQRRVVGEWEGGNKIPTGAQLRIFERVFGLPAGFLDGNFESVDDFWKRLNEHGEGPAVTVTSAPMVADATPSPFPVTDLDSNRQLLPFNPKGIRSLGADYQVTKGYIDPIEKIRKGLEPNARERLRIVVVQGQAGVGKSQLIAEWFYIHGHEMFPGNLFSMNCGRRPGDQILREMTRHYLGIEHEQEIIDRDVIHAINSQTNPLIVLDGLVEQDPVSPSVTATAPTDADPFAFRRVRQLLKDLARAQAKVSVLLGIQMTSNAERPVLPPKEFHAGVSVTTIQAQPLSDEDGARLLELLGVREVAQADLRHVSHALMGLPISLEAAATYLIDAPLLEREDFIARRTRGDVTLTGFEEFFADYVRLLNRGAKDKEAHPHAFLRLLALMPGPVSAVHIESLFAAQRIQRLRRATLEGFRRSLVAFVDYLPDAKIDVHPLARSLLRKEMNLTEHTNLERIHTNREELLWIHSRMAEICLSSLPSDSQNMFALDIDAIEGAIYHLLSSRDLLSQKNKISNNSDLIITGSIKELCRMIACDELSDEYITEYCFNFLAKVFLFDRHHYLTRSLGMFETKAKILTYFCEGHSLSGNIRFLAPAEQHKLYSEIGIAWMHAGRLQLADKAIDKAHRVLNGRHDGPQRLGWSRWQNPEFRCQWIERSVTLSTLSIIRMRLGRPAESVLDQISTELQEAYQFANDFLEGHLDPHVLASRELKDIARAARRLIARHGQILLGQGKVMPSLDAFKLARALEIKLGRSHLEGDAARRHIQALIRSAPTSFETRLETMRAAQGILDANVRTWDADLKGRRRQSNEIIQWWTTRALLWRMEGYLDKAEETCRQTLTHEFVKRGECTFVAKVELQLELARCLIIAGHKAEEAKALLNDLCRTARESHHWSYELEASVLLAELLKGDEQRKLLDSAAVDAKSRDWVLRWQDIQEIREGGSAIQTFGC